MVRWIDGLIGISVLFLLFKCFPDLNFFISFSDQTESYRGCIPLAKNFPGPEKRQISQSRNGR